MARRGEDRRPHFFLEGTSESKRYTAHQAPRDKYVPPALARKAHGSRILDTVNRLQRESSATVSRQRELGLTSGLGLQVSFVSQPDVELAFESLQNETKSIELLSIRPDGNRMLANVFVPDGKLAHFEKYITDYIEERRSEKGRALDHAPLIDTIADIRRAELAALWTDDPELLPRDHDTSIWWEVWLPVREDRQGVLADFNRIAALAECQVSERIVYFPERTVALAFASTRQLTRSVRVLNCIAELRLAKRTAHLVLEQAAEVQADLVTQLSERTAMPPPGKDVPHVCVLDTGVNRGHLLLSGLLAADDMHTVMPGWGLDDTVNHGTGMAGLATYGDLAVTFQSNHPVEINHRLESVKVLNADGANEGGEAHHAYLFAEAVSRPEVDFPNRRRVYTCAITADDYRDRGRPSAWSAALDTLAASPESTGQSPRLFVVAAGNTFDAAAWKEYPASLSTNLIHDPGQAWNAITVGAFTEKAQITEPDAGLLTPIAVAGGLSPRTTTSATWNTAWPLKPDVVFEGGNVAQDNISAVGMESLDLLTTSNTPAESPFCPSNGTSVASAQCAKLAAELMADFPTLRPETIRGLIVHSAEWTLQMKDAYLGHGPINKSTYRNLIRHCGWGVPSIERARWSARDSLTLVVEDLLYPYSKARGKPVKTREMHLHRIPWPREELERLGERNARMRVTLSYFVEPNPSTRGSTSKFHYPSFRLRFDVRRPLETMAGFMARINAEAAAADENEGGNPRDPHWYLGDGMRHRGSLHQDVWEGPAIELAKRTHIAVYPAMGWWRTRPAMNRYGLPARYSLIISVETPDIEVDLYAEVANQIAVEVQVDA